MADMTIKGGRFSIPVYEAKAAGNEKGAVILIHEVWGLNDHVRHISDRFAAEGFTVIAPDLISQTGILEKIDPGMFARAADPEKRDEVQKEIRAAMAPIQSEEFGQETVERLKEIVDYCRNELHIQKVAVIGFCFGGTYAYELAGADPRIKGALPFYGHAPKEESKFEAITCPVYAFYGEDDKALVDDLPRVASLMEKFHKNFTYKVYPNTGHAFMNDTNPRMYNPVSAADAWQLALGFLGQIFA